MVLFAAQCGDQKRLTDRETRQLSLFETTDEPALAETPSAAPVESAPDLPPSPEAPLLPAPPRVDGGAPREGDSPSGAGVTPENRPAQIEIVRTACLQCTACDLSSTRTQVVFGEGSIQSPLVIIGEGPGEQEDATGRPFVGRAGMLLDQALRENGILRQHVWITNVLKCRACLVEGRRKQNRPPRVEEVAACRRWLEQELKILSPLVILCLGGPAASWVIHPDFRITRERGQWFSTSWASIALATLHPAYVLRQVGEAYDAARATLVQDIGAARQKAIELKNLKNLKDPKKRAPALT